MSTDNMTSDNTAPRGAKRKQIKVAGLIQRGVITPPPDAEEFALQELPGQRRPADAPCIDGTTPLPRAVRQRIKLASIVDSPYQPRLVYDPEELDELSRTMQSGGLADPVRVRPVSGHYELISGHRRTRAARSLGWEDIDAIVEQRTDREAEIAAMLLVVGNVHISDFELAKMFERAITQGYCKTQAQVADFFGYTQGKVSGCLALLALPPGILVLLENKPGLFGRDCCATIIGLLKEYPDHLTTVVAGVSRLADGMQQTALKGWVRHAIRHEAGLGDAGAFSARSPKTFAKGGLTVFMTKIEPRAVTVKLKSPLMDIGDFEARLNAWLDQDAAQFSDTLKATE